MSCGYIKPHSKETDLLVTETIRSWNRVDGWRDTAAIAWPPLGKQVVFPQEEGPETTTLLIPLVFLISSQHSLAKAAFAVLSWDEWDRDGRFGKLALLTQESGACHILGTWAGEVKAVL